ncbi:MAG: hypothetical protein F4Z25_11435 [Chloroflexi bacterium]|nr:hypothetical protein [Chloroflexota bacterium]
MPIPDEFREIVANLEEGTKINRVPWATTGAEGIYTAAYGDYSVSIAQRRLLGGEGPAPRVSYRVVAFDENGEEVDAFVISASDGPAYVSVRSLWRAARRKANNIDEKLQAIAERIRLENERGRLFESSRPPTPRPRGPRMPPPS